MHHVLAGHGCHVQASCVSLALKRMCAASAAAIACVCLGTASCGPYTRPNTGYMAAAACCLALACMKPLSPPGAGGPSKVPPNPLTAFGCSCVLCRACAAGTCCSSASGPGYFPCCGTVWCSACVVWHAGCLHLQAGGGSWRGWSGSLVQVQVGLRVIHWGAAAVLVVSVGYLWVTWPPWAASQAKQPSLLSHRHQGMSSLLAYLLLFGCLCAPAPSQHAARLLSWNACLQCVGRCTVLSVLCCACLDAATTNMKPLLASYVLTQRESAMHGMAGTQATAGQPARAAALSPQVPVPYSVWHKALICARRCRR